MPSVQRIHDEKNTAIIHYPMREARIDITRAEYDLVHYMVNNKVGAIKFIRAQYNLGLYEAKNIVDTIHASPNPYL